MVSPKVTQDSCIRLSQTLCMDPRPVGSLPQVHVWGLSESLKSESSDTLKGSF